MGSTEVQAMAAVQQAEKQAPAPQWTVARVEALMALPLPELMHQAQLVHRAHFDPCEVEFATLLSVKTGGCPEDCSYCPQAARYDTGVTATKLMEPAEVMAAAEAAKARAPPVSAWAPPGAPRKTATSRKCPNWCAA